MESEITFPHIYRGFLKDKQQFVYGNLLKMEVMGSPLDYGIKQDTYYINSTDHNSCPDWNLPYNRINHFVKMEDIDICTMVKDRNGTLMFTGDYIKFHSDTVFTIKYNYSIGCFVFVNEELGLRGNFIDCNPQDALIVGNRHIKEEIK